MGGSKREICALCTKLVGKNSHALKCASCAEWVHVGCGDLIEDDYNFLKAWEKFGFRWFCDGCIGQSNQMKGETAASTSEESLEKVVSAMEDVRKQIFKRMDVLEAKISGQDATLGCVCPPKAFSEVVKEALKESKREQEHSGVNVNMYGKNTTVHSQHVLVVKRKPGGAADAAGSTTVRNKVEDACRTICVDSCRENTKTGTLVVKFPSGSAKEEASSAMKACLEGSPDYVVSEPKKMFPKLTVVGIPISVPENKILDSILEKNNEIDDLKKKGYMMDLLFITTKTDSKTAVLKVSPEIRACVEKKDWYIYVGLSRCKTYDRFWVNQCYHCQQFGHKAAFCPKKDDMATCAFCAGRHASRDCSDKSSPKCANCVNVDDPPQTDHFASSRTCPVMISQRRKVIENTEFACTKNM